MYAVDLGTSDLSDLILPQKNSYTESAILCPACRTEHEDEIHFLPKCPAYVSIRQQHIPTNESSANIQKYFSRRYVQNSVLSYLFP